MNIDQLQVARRQWQQLGPQTITYQWANGRTTTHTLDPKKYMRDDGKLLVRYNGRKRKGEDWKPMVQIKLALDEALDLYDVEVEVYDGNLDMIDCLQYNGMYVECLANLSHISYKDGFDN